MGAIKLSCVSFGNANLQKILPLVHFSMTKTIVNVASQCVYLYLKDLHVQKGVYISCSPFLQKNAARWNKSRCENCQPTWSDIFADWSGVFAVWSGNFRHCKMGVATNITRNAGLPTKSHVQRLFLRQKAEGLSNEWPIEAIDLHENRPCLRISLCVNAHHT